jgi:hypothetical protein
MIHAACRRRRPTGDGLSRPKYGYSPEAAQAAPARAAAVLRVLSAQLARERARATPT